MMFWGGFIAGFVTCLACIVGILVAAIWNQRGPNWARPWGGL